MSLKEIEEEEFNSCPNVTIYAPAGSETEAFAKWCGIPFQEERIFKEEEK